MYVALSEHFVQVGLTSTLLYMSLNEKTLFLYIVGDTFFCRKVSMSFNAKYIIFII